MKTTGVSLISNEFEAIRFDLRNVPSKSPYQIRTILGIDADELIPKFYGFNRAGTKKFYDFSLKPRDIVMRIVLAPRFHLDENHSDVRDALYKVISATRTGEIKLLFHSGASTVAQIFGFITKFEVAHFAKTPELQLTVRCNDPMFKGINPIVYRGVDLPPLDPHVEIADSASTAPHGFKLKVTCFQTFTQFLLQDTAVDPEWRFLVIPQTSFLNGDIIYFSSEFNNKYFYRERAGVITHLADGIEPTSVWPLIFPGFNEFYFDNNPSFSWNYIEYSPAYWGV